MDKYQSWPKTFSIEVLHFGHRGFEFTPLSKSYTNKIKKQISGLRNHDGGIKDDTARWFHNKLQQQSSKYSYDWENENMLKN